MSYEIALAESLGIPVLALYDSRSGNPISAMIAGNPQFPAVRYGSFLICGRCWTLSCSKQVTSRFRRQI
jgi:hypothetical protein